MRFKPVKHCLYGVKGIVFVSLLIACYFQYMKSALEDYLMNSLTVVIRSEEITKYEPPAITVCANYDFKPSVQINNNFDFPTRYLFHGKNIKFLLEDPKTLERVYDFFQNKSVEELFRSSSYADDLMFIGDGEDLKIVSLYFIIIFIKFSINNFLFKFVLG